VCSSDRTRVPNKSSDEAGTGGKIVRTGGTPARRSFKSLPGAGPATQWWDFSARRRRALRPTALRLPAPVAFDRRLLLHAEVHLLDVLIGLELLGGAFQHDAAGLQHEAVVGRLQGDAGVLLHQEHGGSLAVDLFQHL